MPSLDRFARRSRGAALVAAVAVAACSHDLDLPPASTAPALTDVAPAEAWAGQLVRVRGAALDADPAANVIAFAGASARGLRWEGDALVVRVPDDAGSGPLIATNGSGTSEPFGAFEYLGLGEPRRRAIASRTPILHRPAAVHAVGGDVFLHSGLYGGLVKADDPSFATVDPSVATERAVLSAAAPWDGSLYFTTFDPVARIVYLSRLDTAGVRTGQIVLPFEPSQLLAMRGIDAIVAFGTDDAGVESLAAWDLRLQATLVDPTPQALGAFFGAADVGDGRAAVVAYDEAFTTLTVAVLDIQSALSGPLPAPALLPGSPEEFALASSNLVGIAVAGGGPPYAAITLPGGDLAVADLGPFPAFAGTVETFSATPVEGLAGAATLPVVLATKAGDGLSVGVDLASRALLWSVPGDAPTVASANGDLAFVAHRDDNDVSVVNLATGSRVARVNLDVEPATPGVGYGGAAAFLARDETVPGSEDELFFPASRFPGLVRFPLGSGAPSVVSRTANVALVASSASPAAVWAASDPGAVEPFLGRSYAAPVPVPLPGAPLLAAVDGTRLAVAYAGGLAIVDGAALAGWTDVPGATEFEGMGFNADGRLWTALSLADGAHVQLWDPAQLSTSGTPEVDVALAAMQIDAAVRLEDGVWLLGRTHAGTVATLLGPDLAEVRTVPLAAGIPAVHAVSPNGRLLASREIGGAPGQTVVRFHRADPGAGFPEVDALVFEGLVEGLAFDASGERLWVVTRAPDRVVLVD